MVPWVSWSRALATYAARHPTVQRMMRDGSRRLYNSDVVQRGRQLASALAARAARITQEKATGKAASGSEKSGPHFSMYNRLRRRTMNAWYQHRARLLSFLFANFMFIIIALQLLSAAWQALRQPHKPRHVTAEQQQQPRRDATTEAAAMAALNARNEVQSDATAMRESLPRTLDSAASPLQHTNNSTLSSRETDTAFAFYEPPPMSTSSALFDDVAADSQATSPFAKISNNNDERNADWAPAFTASPATESPINFDTSFLVKMDDEREFTSSLEREHLTGKVQVDPLSGRPSI